MGLPAYAFWQALRIKTMNYRIIFHTTGKVLLVEAGLLALGLSHHWRLMRVDRQVPRPAAGKALTEAAPRWSE